jgi:hypothetical protein
MDDVRCKICKKRIGAMPAIVIYNTVKGVVYRYFYHTKCYNARSGR